MSLRILFCLAGLALAIAFAASCQRDTIQESSHVRTAHVSLYPEGDRGPLPPYQSVLTSSEMKKLESMDPLLSSIYVRRWRAVRVSPGLAERLLHQFRSDLAAAPVSTPAILDSGYLKTTWGPLWEELPETLDFTRQYIAHKLVTAGQLEQDDLDALEDQLARLDDLPSKELFASGFVPGDRPDAPTPLVCEWDASTGVWFEWAVPPAFRTGDPQDEVLRMPPPETALSRAARAKLDSMDAELQRAFQRHWSESSGSAQAMACLALRTDRYLAHVPVTELPEMSTILTPQGVSLFEDLPQAGRQAAIDFVSMFIVTGEIRIGGVHGQPRQEVDAYGMSDEQFLRELRKTAEVAVNVVAHWDS